MSPPHPYSNSYLSLAPQANDRAAFIHSTATTQQLIVDLRGRGSATVPTAGPQTHDILEQTLL